MGSLVQLIESKVVAQDPYTMVHQRRVARIASTIAREMGLTRPGGRDRNFMVHSHQREISGKLSSNNLFELFRT